MVLKIKMDRISKHIDGWFVLMIIVLGVWWLIAGGTVTTASKIQELSGSTDPDVWIEALKSDDRTIRNYARDHMSEVLTPETLETVATDIFETGDLEMSDAGLWLLTQIDVPNRAEIATGYLEDDNADIRKTALEVLVETPYPEAHDRIVELTDDPDREVQTEALRALVALSNPDDLPIFISFLGYTNATVRNEAHDAILAIADSVPGVIPSLFDVANGPELSAAREALELLGQIGGDEAIDGLFDFLYYGSVALVSDGANAISAIGGDEVSARALDLYQNGENRQRTQAAKVLGAIGVSEAAPFLWSTVTDTSRDFWLRYNSMTALATCADESMVEDLLAFIAETDHDPRLTRAGIETLGGIGGDRVIELYDLIIAHEIDFDLGGYGGDPALLSVIAGLGKMDADRSRERLHDLAATTDPDNLEFLIEITKSLGNVGTSDDIEFLIELEKGKPVLSGFVDQAVDNIRSRHPE